MEYPLISEYREAILSAEDNFSELSSLRAVVDSHGSPIMSSGNFAVVFKMRDENDGKLYAVKCFIKDQKERDESYKKIADELEIVSSSYILPLRYLEKELFVDSAQCECNEFPVVVMEWVEGDTLDEYVKKHLDDTYELEMLSYRFSRMALWLLSQPFAHGDIKPENIIVRSDGSIVMVDYDGMFVPSMQGEKAREIGSPDYRHPMRSDTDFNEHIDDFSIAVIALSLKAIALCPKLKEVDSHGDTLLLTEKDFQSPHDSKTLQSILSLSNNSELATLLGLFYIALGRKSLEAVNFRLFIMEKPRLGIEKKVTASIEKIDTSCSDEDLLHGELDSFGVKYSKDGSRLLECVNRDLKEYNIKSGTKIICDNAFAVCRSLESVTIPDSVAAIGENPFRGCWNINIRLYANPSLCIINELLIDKTGILISCFNGTANIDIPNSVTSIGNSAFECCDLHSVTIPNSVTHIGNSAFEYCTSLQSVTIPDSITSIGSDSFAGCVSLQSVTIPDSVTYIGANPFRGCDNINLRLPTKASLCLINELLIDNNGILISCFNRTANIDIPDSVTYIGNSAFEFCTSLQSVTIPDSVTYIGDYAFKDCFSLRNVIIPNSVTSIGSGAFSKCHSLKSVTIPDSVTYIGDSAFKDCDSLQSVTIPDSATSIGDSAFKDCHSLKSETIPDSVTFIGDFAFKSCRSLESITVPNPITSIGNYAFEGCYSLKSVTIPISVDTLGANPFRGCNNINLRLSDKASLCVMNELLIDKNGQLISCFNRKADIDIPDYVTTIGDSAFYDCRSLQNVTIPDSVTSIGEFAFCDCHSLQGVTIPDSVTAIGNFSFMACTSLQSVNIPISVTSIGDYAFMNCPLNSVTIPDSIAVLGANPFRGCKYINLRLSAEAYFCIINKLLIDKNGQLISCFNRASNIDIPDYVTAIGDSAFAFCRSLHSVTIPDSVTTIGKFAFRNCPLDSVTIPYSVTSIGDFAFSGCKSLQSVTIPDSVTFIGNHAFDSGCEVIRK